MAKATIRSGLDKTRTLKYTHNAATAPGDILLVNGQVLVAIGTAAANVVNTYAFRGRVEFPKEAPLVIAPGENCFWVAAASNLNKTSAGNTAVGICVEAAAEADTIVLVELIEN